MNNRYPAISSLLKLENLSLPMQRLVLNLGSEDDIFELFRRDDIDKSLLIDIENSPKHLEAYLSNRGRDITTLDLSKVRMGDLLADKISKLNSLNNQTLMLIEPLLSAEAILDILGRDSQSKFFEREMRDKLIAKFFKLSYDKEFTSDSFGMYLRNALGFELLDQRSIVKNSNYKNVGLLKLSLTQFFNDREIYDGVFDIIASIPNTPLNTKILKDIDEIISIYLQDIFFDISKLEILRSNLTLRTFFKSKLNHPVSYFSPYEFVKLSESEKLENYPAILASIIKEAKKLINISQGYLFQNTLPNKFLATNILKYSNKIERDDIDFLFKNSSYQLLDEVYNDSLNDNYLLHSLINYLPPSILREMDLNTDLASIIVEKGLVNTANLSQIKIKDEIKTYIALNYPNFSQISSLETFFNIAMDYINFDDRLNYEVFLSLLNDWQGSFIELLYTSYKI